MGRKKRVIKIPHSRKKQVAAAGVCNEDAEIKAACCTPGNWDPAFQPKSPPSVDPEDWLYGPGWDDRAGQSFTQFKRGKWEKPSERKSKIYLVPIGDLGSDDEKNCVDMKAIAQSVEAYFMTQVGILDAIDDSEVGHFRHSRKVEDGTQLKTDDCHNSLLKRKPKDAFCVVGITMYDLYHKEEWHYVFGQCSTNSMTAIFSFNRFRDSTDGLPVDDRLFLQRCYHFVAHEIGHLYGIMHCVWFQCCMNGTNRLDESDAQPIHLCPVDLRKLHLAISPLGKFSIVERYKRLKKWYERNEFLDDEKWIQERLSQIQRKRGKEFVKAESPPSKRQRKSAT